MTRERFIALSTFLMVVTRAADVGVTYQFSPGLALEGNPMVRFFGMGWGFLVAVNVVVVFATTLCSVYWSSKPLEYERSAAVHDAWTFASFACFQRVYSPGAFVWRRILCSPKGSKHTLQFLGVVIPPTFVVISGCAVFSWYAMYGFHWVAYCQFYKACWPFFPYVLAVPTVWISAVLFYRNEYRCYRAVHQAASAPPSFETFPPCDAGPLASGACALQP